MAALVRTHEGLIRNETLALDVAYAGVNDGAAGKVGDGIEVKVGMVLARRGATWIGSEARTGGMVVHDATSEVTVETLAAFADAWNRHDADALMTFMSADCVFESSAGPEVCGTRYVGREAVRAGYVDVWTTFPDAHWGKARHFVHGDRGVSEWTFTGTRTDGSRVEVHGCDLFTFRDGRIALKDSYRKNRPAQGAGR